MHLFVVIWWIATYYNEIIMAKNIKESNNKIKKATKINNLCGHFINFKILTDELSNQMRLTQQLHQNPLK